MRHYLLFTIAILALLTSCETADCPEYQSQTPQYFETSEKGLPQEAWDIINGLTESFNTDTRSGKAIYPDWYGGMYVNDYDRVVVLATDSATHPQIPDGAVIKRCRYSYNHLDSVQKVISERTDNNEEVRKHLTGFGIFDNSNTIRVMFDKCTPQTIEQFRQTVSDDPSIEFEEMRIEIDTPDKIIIDPGDSIKVPENILKCGDFLINPSTKYGASLGYRVRVKNSKKTGIITSGHFISKGSVLCSFNNDTIGTCLQSYDKSIVDAAFCEITNRDYLPTNQINFKIPSVNFILSTELAQTPNGLYVHAIGAKTQMVGKVVCQSYELHTSDRLLKDVILTSFNSTQGDSGGLVYAVNTNAHINYTEGIIMGNATIPSDPDNKYCVCIKAYMINNAFNVERY